MVSELLELYKPKAPQEFPSLPLGFVGAPYHAELPAFTASDPTKLRLTAQPSPPRGLEFRDMGNGVGVIEGTPRASGSTTLEVTATSDKGQSATMDVVVVVAAAALGDTPSSPPAPSEAKPSPVALAPGASTIDRRTRFLRGYDGGGCIFARALSEPINDKSVEVISADADAFARFAADFRRAVGDNPPMFQQAIDRAECPTLQLLKVAQLDGGAAAPRIALESRTVGPSAPLAGRISGLAGRTLKLLVVKNDGATMVMPATPAGADVATFRQAFTGIGPEDVGHTLAVIAIVSDKPLNALAELAAPRARGRRPRKPTDWWANCWRGGRRPAERRTCNLRLWRVNRSAPVH